MLRYVVPVIAFSAALLALLGDTLDMKKRGIRRLTWVGWLSGTLATGSLIIAVAQVHREHLDAAHRVADQQRIRRVAYDRIAAAVDVILEPFELMDQATSHQPIAPDSALTASRDSQGVAAPRVQAMLRFIAHAKEEPFVGRLRTLQLSRSPGADLPGLTTMTWAQEIQVAAHSGDHELEAIEVQYREVLDATTIELIHGVQAHQFLLIMGVANNQFLRVGRARARADLTVAWVLLGPYEPRMFYVPFFDLLSNLLTHLQIVDGEWRR